MLAWLTTRGKWKPARHLTYLDDYLIKVEQGEITRLAVQMPVRHGKSTLTSLAYPVWWLGKHPDDHLIFCSYAAEYAASWSRQARDLFHTYAPSIFGLDVSNRSSAANRWGIKGHLGGELSVGVGGGITGWGADLSILDDVIKNPEQVDSPTQLEKMDDWYESVLETRLNFPDVPIIMMMSRWSKQDLLGKMEDRMGKGLEKWTIIKLPAIAGTDDPMGRAEGEALWPERWPLEYLHKRQLEMKARWFEALYQQNPISDGGQICPEEWWQYWDMWPKCDRIIQSYDTAFKKNAKSDYSVIQTWGSNPRGYYLLHMWRDKASFPELQRKGIELFNRFKPDLVLIESKASGQSLAQVFRELLPASGDRLGPYRRIPVEETNPTDDKPTRAKLVTPEISSGYVFVPKYDPINPDYPDDVPFTKLFVTEWSQFPQGGHDDIVDTASQALTWFKGKSPIRDAEGKPVRMTSGHGIPEDLMPHANDAARAMQAFANPGTRPPQPSWKRGPRPRRVA